MKKYRRPSNAWITRYSTTLARAKKAALKKWFWMLTATKIEILGDKSWPLCGFCYLRSHTHPYMSIQSFCGKICPLVSCWADSLHHQVIEAYGDLADGSINLTQFRVSVKRMIKRIEEVEA